MEVFNLYNLPDDVLFKSNDNFYDFVSQVFGKVEADILKVQGIRNVHSLIRSKNLLAILELDCDEVNTLKCHACFECKDGSFITRQGVKLNLDHLFDVLKNKHEKYKKKNQQRLQESILPVSQSASLNIDQTNITMIPNSIEEATTISSQYTPTFTTSTPNPSSFNSHGILMSDHVIFIENLIEKYSRKIFMSISLKRNEHYELVIKQNNEALTAMIKCKCGTKLTLPGRVETSTFILSNYYAHLTKTNCSMVEHIFKQEKISKQKELVIMTTPAPPLQSSISFSNDDNTSVRSSPKRKHDESSKNESNSTNTKTKSKKKAKFL